jgi:hypothetical protein
MIRVVIAELRKLRRPTLLLGTIATVGGLSALFTSIPVSYTHLRAHET